MYLSHSISQLICFQNNIHLSYNFYYLKFEATHVEHVTVDKGSLQKC